MTDIITWQDGTPFSTEFNDVYFCRENGLAESRYVFLESNNLPLRWQNIDKPFTIIETGFGTGLNFFAAQQLWQEHAKSGGSLHYISIEKYPLSATDIIKSAELWPELLGYATELADKYPQYLYGNHIIKLNNNITLELLFVDIIHGLPQINTKADAWFLDGFAPSKNPDMWNDELYQNMFRLTNSSGSFATFTSVGEVKRGLQAAGFNVEKAKGFGKKRHMLRGILEILDSTSPSHE
ncbi:MAG: mnmC [Rickettsiaceae bacterium]|jgi:tRNA 5-methylaminomethyl-2-thiouridine biosynthesis bifunctional protein|nr:mnmC [Rickettsiaceae bacterium]